jgi:hypothetical protein
LLGGLIGLVLSVALVFILAWCKWPNGQAQAQPPEGDRDRSK